MERFNPAILAAEPYLDSPLFIESHRIAPFVPRSTDVAVVLDLMIHDVDLVCGLVGDPIQDIAAAGLPVLTPNVDIANARLTFEGGAVANLTASRVSLEKMRKLRIFQRSGYLSLNLADGTGEFLRLKEDLPFLSGDDVTDSGAIPEGGMEGLVERIPLEGERVEPLRSELESFRDACLGHREPAVSRPGWPGGSGGHSFHRGKDPIPCRSFESGVNGSGSGSTPRRGGPPGPSGLPPCRWSSSSSGT